MKRLAHTDYPVVALTHPGMKGKNNEDCYGVSAYSLDPVGPWPVLLAVLCDGIGGHRAGEVAAEIAVERISREVGLSNAANPTQVLNAAVQAASDAIYARAKASPLQSGMGATCACAWIIGDALYTATVGDSRLYLLRDGVIRRLSTDHTWVQEAIEQGILTPEQIRGHPNQHVIRRYLGGPTPPEVDLRLRLRVDEDDLQAETNQGMRIFPGDIILLTSDGLTDLVSDDEICAAYKVLTGQGQVSAQTAGHHLIDLANRRGGHDNITLVAISVPSQKMDAAARLRRWVNHNWVWAASGCAVLLITLVIAAGLAGGWWWTKRTAGTLPTVSPTSSAPVTQGTELPTLTPMPTAEANPPASFLTPTFTPSAQFPPENGPTLTPWPTNTPGE